LPPGRAAPDKEKTYSVEALTPDGVWALIAQCSETSSLGIRHRALITLLYRTGLRAAEALAILRCDHLWGSTLKSESPIRRIRRGH